MKTPAAKSLINHTGFTLGAVMLMAVINMLVSFLTAESAENDAVRINLAGSLRMQSYRISEALFIQSNKQLNPNNQNLIDIRIAEFEGRLYRPVLSAHIKNASHTELITLFDILDKRWKELKKQLVNKPPATAELLLDIDNFVVLINELVTALELQTESKFRLLRLFQGLSLLMTCIVVTLGYIDVSSNVVAPLKRLMVAADKIRGGNFSGRLKVDNDNELSLLANTFNEMSESLDAMYRELEQRVHEKTLHLEQARDGLALLYETSRLLSAEGSVIARIERSLAHINNYFSDTKIAMILTQEGSEPFHLTAPGQPDYQKTTLQYKIHIGRQNLKYGELLVSPRQPLLEEQKKLLQAIADNIAAALNADWQQDRQHRLVLMEERAVIARELHDSLAQSLAYLKIQISRLQMLKIKGNDPAEMDNTVALIKNGIDAAYGQLRELLTTFRLQLSNEGLQSALKKTAAEFSKQGEISITLDYHLDNFPLTPNEEIHILQIVREAISNVVRHSGASKAEIRVTADPHRNVEVSISDNGSGFTNGDSNNHYGKIIMQERAKTLGGQVNFNNLPQGGAQVILRFAPDVAKTPEGETLD